MATPAAVTGFTGTEEAGDSTLQLSWSHTGTDLDRFEILYKDPNETYNRSYGIFDKADLLVSGTNYEIYVQSLQNWDWTVRALSGSGADSPSAVATAVRQTQRVKGIKLKAYKDGKLQDGNDGRPDLRVSIRGELQLSTLRDVQAFVSPFRKERMYQFGVTHFDTGLISGKLVGDDDVGSANIYRNRLRRLVKEQHKYRIQVISESHEIWSAKFPEELTSDLVVHPEALWDINLPFAQVSEGPPD